jgi:cytochrome oxidase Cu insertion factor (SCO1/SenC/PrrC family)
VKNESASSPRATPDADDSLGSPGLRLLISLVGGALVVAALAAGFFARGTKPEEFFRPDRERSLGNFTLTDRTGRTVTRADLRDQYAVVSFVFTSCGTTCLRVSRQMAAVQRDLAGAPDVRLVSLTVDPRTDTPAQLSRFAAKFGAETNRWLFLTGDAATLYPLIETSFLPRATAGEPVAMPGDFLHTERIAVLDRGGDVRAYFDGLSTNTPAAIIRFLDRLRAENAKP